MTMLDTLGAQTGQCFSPWLLWVLVAWEAGTKHGVPRYNGVSSSLCLGSISQSLWTLKAQPCTPCFLLLRVKVRFTLEAQERVTDVTAVEQR